MNSKKPTYKELEQRIVELESREQIRACQDTAHALLDATTESVFLLDQQGVFITANKVTADRLGTTVEKLIGKSFTELLPPEQAESRMKILTEVVKNKKPVQLQDKREGRIIDCSVVPILNKQGEVYRIAIFGRDVTREKAYENELLQNKHYMDVLFNSTLNGVIVVDAENHKIVDANNTALKMIGRDKKSVVGRECHNFVCPAEKGKCPIADLGQKVDMSERTLITANSGEQPILKTVKTLKIGEKPYYIESFIDITDLKEAEQAREKLIEELSDALEKVKTLSGLMPICAKCKKIRDDKGYWNNLESYIEKYSEASFSHGLCPECSDEMYGDQQWYIKGRKKRKREDKP
ncbi:PAS domain-containing protein [Marinifilum sp. JC120]|nr:PAS domain-containing protein [Marinifilum sp. JC120]